MKNKIYIPYGRQSITDKDIQAVSEVLYSPFITQGPIIQKFEKALAGYVGSKYAVAFSSGTAALHAAAFSAGIRAGDEAITTPITFVATANCILYQEGIPVFADIDPITLTINSEEIKRGITKRTKCVLPVDLAGHPSNLEKIFEIARENNLVIIEDAAHSIGAEYQDSKGINHKCGDCSHADMAIFSFHPVKHITTGEGGMVVTNNEDYCDKLRSFRTHGIIKEKGKMSEYHGEWYYEMQNLGYNYRITDFQCALGLSQLNRLDEFIDRRREIVNIYNESFKDILGLIIPEEAENVKSSFHLYILQIEARIVKKTKRQIFHFLREQGIIVNVHYIPVHYQPYYKKRFGDKKGQYPHAEKYYERALTLPLYPTLNNNEIEYVIKKVLESINN